MPILPFKIYRITGNSMLPTLAEGDYVIAFRWWWRLKVGNLIVAKHEHYPLLIKRIKSLKKNGHLCLQGDGPESISSEQIGELSQTQVLGKVLYCIKAKTQT